MPEDERKYSDEIKLYCNRLNIEYHCGQRKNLGHFILMMQSGRFMMNFLIV